MHTVICNPYHRRWRGDSVRGGLSYGVQTRNSKHTVPVVPLGLGGCVVVDTIFTSPGRKGKVWLFPFTINQ